MTSILTIPTETMKIAATPAIMVSKPRLFFACPHCGADDKHSVTHFLLDKTDHSFGPWQCDACGWVVDGIWHPATKSVSITSVKEQPKPIKGYLLLRFAPSKTENPIWFVVEDDIHTRDGLCSLAEEMESKRYWVDEHTCPTNIVRVAAIIEGHGASYNDDPHGVLKFATWTPRPSNLPDREDPDWCILFPQLATETIDGAAVRPAILIASGAS